MTGSSSEASASASESSFWYRAARPDGRIVTGRSQARSVGILADSLQSRGLFPLQIEQRAPPLRLRRRTRKRDLAVVFRSVAALTAVGVPVERALAASERLAPEHLRLVLRDVRRRIREGATPSGALLAHPGVFPRVVVGMIRGGERSSRLTEALEQVADQLEEETNLGSQIRSALAYPALILVVGLLSVLVMGTVVVPRFAEVLGDLGAELPTGTRLLLWVSAGLRRYGGVLLLAAAATGGLFVSWSRRPEGGRTLDRLLLRAPVVGGIRHGFASARACRALGGMLRSGMPLLAALDAVEESVGDAEVAIRLRRARARVAKGERLTPSLREEEALSDLALQLVGVGETSGRLGDLALRAGAVSADEAHRSLRSLVSLVEPALVVTLGAGVALIAGALLQAVYSVRPGG